MILTSSPYKQDLETSVKKKEETNKLKKRLFNTKNKAKKMPKNISQKKRKISKSRDSSESTNESDFYLNDNSDES